MFPTGMSRAPANYNNIPRRNVLLRSKLQLNESGFVTFHSLLRVYNVYLYYAAAADHNYTKILVLTFKTVIYFIRVRLRSSCIIISMITFHRAVLVTRPSIIVFIIYWRNVNNTRRFYKQIPEITEKQTQFHRHVVLLLTS